jgi:cysteine synthase A
LTGNRRFKMIFENNLEMVGNTPMVRLKMEEFDDMDIFAKLEFYNPTGSVKDRAAFYIIKKLLEKNEINKNTTLIESSSGNFGVALSAYCKKNNLNFICVVDPCISPINEMLIKAFGAKVIKVKKPDENGGFLLNRIKKVNELTGKIKNSYWINQYGNPYNAEAYYRSLGSEICDSMEQIDYTFLGVSSGGTITGASNKIKEKFPDSRMIAVDICGSVIFGNPPKKRYIPGIGSSMVPDILKQAKIDDVVMVDEISTIKMCRELLSKHNIFAGGSSGSVIAGIKKYFAGKTFKKRINIATIFPDRGDRYTNTIYNEEWYTDFIKNVKNK